MNAVVIYAHIDDKCAVALADRLAQNDTCRVVLTGHTKRLEPSANVTVIREKCLGLGASVKLALDYIRNSVPNCVGIATVTDAARHNAEEIIRVCCAAGRDKNTLLLGSAARGIEKLHAKIDRRLFSLVSGRSINDIHASLRAFGSDMLALFTNVAADSGAYEVEMLLAAARSGAAVREVDIIANNISRRPHDWRHLREVYVCAILFLFSSLFAFGLEFALLLGIEKLCTPLGQGMALTISVSLSRIISCIINYIMNRKLVFKSTAAVGSSVIRYFAVAAFVLVINYLLLRLCVMVIGWPLWISKFIVETALFFVNFFLQGKFVY